MRNRGLRSRPAAAGLRSSVSPSVTFTYCLQTAEDISNFFLGPVD